MTIIFPVDEVPQEKQDSTISLEDLHDQNKGDRPRIRALLLKEQYGFCAYLECFVKQIDSLDIEHFDGRIKQTEADGYENWYAVLHFMNTHKLRIIEAFLPILPPSNPDLSQRIRYEDGVFKPLNIKDIEARNLISYLGFNRYELCEERSSHLAKIKGLLGILDGDEQELRRHLDQHKEELSFCTALESELGLSLSDLIFGDGID